MKNHEVSDKILEMTKDGPLVEWVERIGVISRKLGLRPEFISWNGSPVIVIFSMLQEYKACNGTLDGIEDKLNGIHAHK